MASTHVPDSLAAARRILNGYLGRWSVSGTELRVNTRLTTTLARCMFTERTVEVSRSLLSRDSKTQREVLCHEAAHLVVYARHGINAAPHGAEWRELMRQARFAPRATILGSACGGATAHKTRERKHPMTVYEHRCPVCQFVRTARRAVPQWRCRECLDAGLDGRLLITTSSDGAK